MVGLRCTEILTRGWVGRLPVLSPGRRTQRVSRCGDIRSGQACVLFSVQYPASVATIRLPAAKNQAEQGVRRRTTLGLLQKEAAREIGVYQGTLTQRGATER